MAGGAEASHHEPAHILIVDDDPRMRSMLARYLSGEGFRVSEAADGSAMRTCLAAGPADLILLDLVLQNEDGLTLARELRSESSLGLIMLTGRSDVIDRVAGLEVGADDYIAKPFHLRELLARLRSVLRRTRSTANASPQSSASYGTVYAFDGWELHALHRRLISPHGSETELTTAEFDLLLAFVSNPGRVLNRDQLMDLTKGRVWAAYDRSIDQRVARLRRKIEPPEGRPHLIRSIRGAGYTFAVDVRVR